MTLHFAAAVGDHDRIVTYWILEENWLKALDALNKQVRELSAPRKRIVLIIGL